MRNFVQDGKILTYTAGAAIGAGEVVKIGSLVGIAQTAAAASGDVITVSTEGVFEVACKSSDVITQGAPLAWDSANSEFTLDLTDNTFAGYAWTAAASGVTTVHIKLAASNYQDVTP